MRNKRGISSMVSYVLLVIVAITISGLVYTSLKIDIPQELADCNPETSIVIERATCDTTQNTATLRILNDGLFNIDGIFIRFAEKNRTTRIQLNEGKETFPPRGTSSGPLKPGESFLAHYSIANAVSPTIQEYTIEIQPAKIEDNRIIPCKDIIVSKSLTCILDTSCEGDSDCSYLDTTCTEGRCNPANNKCRAVPYNTGGSCDDGDSCTKDDFCWNGACVGSAVNCDNGLFCDGEETCDPVLGCQSSGNPCLPEETCVEPNQCIPECIPEEEICGDGIDQDCDGFDEVCPTCTEIYYAEYKGSVWYHADNCILGASGCTWQGLHDGTLHPDLAIFLPNGRNGVVAIYNSLNEQARINRLFFVFNTTNLSESVQIQSANVRIEFKERIASNLDDNTCNYFTSHSYITLINTTFQDSDPIRSLQDGSYDFNSLGDYYRSIGSELIRSTDRVLLSDLPRSPLCGSDPIYLANFPIMPENFDAVNTQGRSIFGILQGHDHEVVSISGVQEGVIDSSGFLDQQNRRIYLEVNYTCL